MTFADWMARRGLLKHQRYYYPGFPGQPGHAACLRCGQPYTSLGIPLDDRPCRGRAYRLEMARMEQEKLLEIYEDALNYRQPLKIVMNQGESE